MKDKFHQALIFLFIITTVTIPVAAVTTGNGTYSSSPIRTIQNPTITYVPTTIQTIVAPTINISQNVGILPIWLIIGIILIIIAISGLLWRYFHPKYVAPDDKE
jgi:hypothetical protein